MKAHYRPKVKAFFDRKVDCLITLFWQVCVVLFWQIIVFDANDFFIIKQKRFCFIRWRQYNNTARQFVKYLLCDEKALSTKYFYDLLTRTYDSAYLTQQNRFTLRQLFSKCFYFFVFAWTASCVKNDNGFGNRKMQRDKQTGHFVWRTQRIEGHHLTQP